MLAYAEKVTLEHCNCEASEVDHLRGLGFSDADILDIVQVTAYYNFVNRLALRPRCRAGAILEPGVGQRRSGRDRISPGV